MELIDISKYQSIADRIKRLSNSHQQTSAIQQPPSTHNHVNISRPPLPSSYLTNQNKQKIETYKHIYPQKTNYIRGFNEQSEGRTFQQSNTFIDDITTQRENRINGILGKHKPTLKHDISSSNTQIQDLLKERREYCQKEQLPPKRSDSIKNQLSKVKSQNSMKISQILDSYNSYKQNKQKFLSEIQNTSETSRERIVSKNLKEQMEKKCFEPENQSSRPSIYIEQSIDNLWNQSTDKREEIKVGQQNFQKNQRKTPKDMMNRVSQLRKRQATQEDQEVQASSRPYQHQARLSNFDVKSKEGAHRLKMALSPRGNRVPGKICKNQQKSLILEKESHF